MTAELNDDLFITMTEKILRSNTTNSITVPNLTYTNHILSKITLDVADNIWEFEVSIKSGNTDLTKLTTAYFKHYHHIDMTVFKYKINDGDKIEINVKPKHCPKDFNLLLKYYYTQSYGNLYYQNTIKLTDLEDINCNLLSEITQQMRPTKLEIHTNDNTLIKGYKFIPKFTSSHLTGNDYELDLDLETPQKSTTIDFTDDNFPDGILNQLKFYQLQLKLEFTTLKKDTVDTPVYFLAYGFKVY